MMRTPLTEALEVQLGRSHDCDCGQSHRITTEEVLVRQGLLGSPGELVESLAARGGEAPGANVLVVSDGNTWGIAGEALFSALSDADLTQPPVTFGEAAPGGGTAPPVEADEGQVAELIEHIDASRRPTILLAVGSGTVNDIVKMAASETALPYAVFATAPSMNGYTSAIAAIEVGGVKRTLPAAAPVLVAADPDVLAAAPPRMARSGLADLLSKPVASADWRMSHLLRGEVHCDRPVEIVDEAVEETLKRAAAIGGGADPEAVAVLFEALLLSGMSMAAAGSSAPASGGEHLISHFLDMAAPYEPGGPRTPALHGEQVGVGTLVSLRLYRELLSLAEGEIDWEAAARRAVRIDDVRALLDEEAGFLPEEVRAGILEQTAEKLDANGAAGEWSSRIRRGWEGLREDLAPRLADTSRYERALEAAGCPTTPSAIGVGDDAFRRAIRLARFIRNRYTVLDLAADVGLLDRLADRALGG